MKKVAFFPGGSSGIGLGCLEKLLNNKEDDWIIFVACRDTDRADVNLVSLNVDYEKLKNVFVIRMDVTNPSQVTKAIEEIKNKGFELDLLLYSAGRGFAGSVEKTSIEELTEQFDVNFFGFHRVIREVMPLLKKGACIVPIISLAALVPLLFQFAYCASKAALFMYTWILRMELKNRFRVSGIVPGDIKGKIKRGNKKNPSFTDARLKAKKEDWENEESSKILKKIEEDEDNGAACEKVADVLLKILHSKNPRPFYMVGKPLQVFLVWLSKLISLFSYGLVERLVAGKHWASIAKKSITETKKSAA